MAYTPLTLHLADPCSEDWQQMTPTGDRGRYCNSCRKQVTDLSQLTDREIVRLLRNSEGGICGRLRKDQLDRPLREYPVPARSWQGWLAAGGLLVRRWPARAHEAGRVRLEFPLGDLELVPGHYMLRLTDQDGRDFSKLLLRQ